MAAAIGIGASAFSSKIGASGAGRAGDVQVEGFRAGQAELAPFREAGLQALRQQQALLGLTGQEGQEAAFQALTEGPGQRFIRERQQRALLRNQAAIGGLGGGNIRTALQEQAAGFAQQDLQNQFARLAGLSTAGQQAAGGIAGLLGQSGQARAGGILGATQARQQFLKDVSSFAGMGAGGGGGGGGMGGLFSDKRVKTDISNFDNDEACYLAVTTTPMRVWRYLEGFGADQDLHFGPMAQDAPEEIRMGEIDGIEMINLHDELMMIAGAIRHMRNKSWH